ncbi:sensor histidine kinase [Mucilaginibacter pedocola]|uniref:Histidine kinase n=1 Tax=Mucilaginibacter pedocola TaxID=1792845 RepID=A0A1S9PJR2_9SPHI|nr:histidine kinase [Mucilaginibacter pedocola]OOQ61186.1 histidine kinase [Mucilaginibacter pedocola]
MRNFWDDGPGQHWFFKYKLYHIPFWCLYHYVWWTVAFGNPFKAAANIVLLPYGLKYIFYVVFEAMAAYFNLYFLLPRYFDTKRYAAYFFYVMLTVVASALLIVGGYYASSMLSGRSLHDLYGNGSNCFYYFMGYALPSAFASMSLAMVIKLIRTRMQQERKLEQIEKAKLETELKFLKEQFNPHFLFNSINSIFILIRKNPEKASAALAIFSDLLRHQLYDCNAPEIALSREIDYLKNYIELEKIRQPKGLKVNFVADEFYTGHLGIAPFVLMTFVENAFKHVCKDEGSHIDIRLKLEGQALEMLVINTRGESTLPGHEGIGLKNVQRRLDLVYPERYNLKINTSGENFEVSLQLGLNELAPEPQLVNA